MEDIICNHCGADLKEVGVWTKNIITYKSDCGDEYFVPKDLQFDDSNGTYCNECDKELSCEIVELIDFEAIIL